MPIHYGIIGTNWITTSWVHAARKTGKWQLHAVYSRTREQAQAFGEQHGCPDNLYTSLDDFAKDPQLQAVYIASPNSLHYEQAKLLLQHKKHVILEKPATSTVKELDELFAVAKSHGVLLIEAYRHIQEANFKLLRRLLIDDKILGRIYGASLQYTSYSSRYTNVLRGEVPNIFSLDFAGGALVDVGVYPVTFAVALFGPPLKQTYVPYICPTGVDAGGLCVLRYEAGFGVQIATSKAWTSAQPCEIYGEEGTITVNFTTDVASVKFYRTSTKETVELAGPCKKVEKPDVNMEEEAEEFARIINERDVGTAAELEKISRDVIAVTMDLRRQNGILYPADRAEM